VFQITYLQEFKIDKIPARNNRNKFSGIYGIVETSSGRIYVGSSADVVNRLIMHRSSLRRDCHHNKFLQRSWNKHKEEQFSFVILELCDRSKLYGAEKNWTQKYAISAEGVFNVGEITETTFGRRATEETKQKLSVARFGKKLHPLVFSVSHREALSKANKERFKNGKPQKEIDAGKYPITIDGRYFESSAAAALGFGVTHSTISEWKKKHGVTGVRGAIINRIPHPLMTKLAA
jgi:group I intron endonuclease